MSPDVYHRLERRNWDHTLAGWGLLIAVVWPVTAIICNAVLAGEPASPAHAEPPVANSVFVDVVVRGRVTSRFEIYNPHSEEQLRAVKELGFTQVILDWPNLHQSATEMGLDVVLAQWWTPQNEVPNVENGIAQAKRIDPKRLVAISMMDEPERNSPDTPFTFYEALYNDLRQRLNQEIPTVKLEISHWGPLSSWTNEHYQAFMPLYRASDRIRLMPYPDLEEGPLSEVYFQMMRSRHLMQLTGRELPQVVILQTWVLQDDPKLPTIDELRVMAYQAMLSGAETVSFFNYDPVLWQRTPGFSQGFAELMRELTDFSQRFRSASVESRMNAEGVLTATLDSPGSGRSTVVVNTNRYPVQGLEPLQVGWVVDSPGISRGYKSERVNHSSRRRIRRLSRN